MNGIVSLRPPLSKGCERQEKGAPWRMPLIVLLPLGQASGAWRFRGEARSFCKGRSGLRRMLGPFAQERVMPSFRSVGLLLIVSVFSAGIAGCVGPASTPSRAELGVNGAAWGYEHPGYGLHTSRGEYYLTVNVTLRNPGTTTIRVIASELTVSWANSSNATKGVSDWFGIEVAGSTTSVFSVSFESTGTRTPLTLQFADMGTSPVSAAVPTPLEPAQEVLFSNVSSAKRPVNLDGFFASPGQTYVWVNFTMQNRWTEPLPVTMFDFKVEDANGSRYTADGRQGPDEIGSGGSANVTIVFEVPAAWAPLRVLFDATFGPWADFFVPAPG